LLLVDRDGGYCCDDPLPPEVQAYIAQGLTLLPEAVITPMSGQGDILIGGPTAVLMSAG